MRNKADIVIIGAGISGCATAYNLAKEGVKNIVVLDKGYICSGSTGACGAGIRMQWGTRMNCLLSKYSSEFYETANETLGYARDVEFKQRGYLLIADTQRELKQFEANVALQQSLGIPSRMVDVYEAKQLVPHINTDAFLGAAFCEKDGFLNPFKTVDAFYLAAKRMGVEFETYTRVTSIRTRGGHVSSVVTSKGIIETPVVINCAGGDSTAISRMVGLDLPIYSERHQILVTEHVAPMQEPLVMSFTLNMYVQQSPHGSFIMGRGDSFEPRDGRVTSSWRFVEEMAKSVNRVLPPIAKLRVVRQWAGLYNITPDKQPVYDASHTVEGFYMAIGFSGHGFMFGPVTGVVMADMALNKTPRVDISRLKLSRFAHGDLFVESSVV